MLAGFSHYTDFLFQPWTEPDDIPVPEHMLYLVVIQQHIPHRAASHIIKTLPYKLLNCWPLLCFDIIRAVQTPFPTQFIEYEHASQNTFWGHLCFLKNHPWLLCE